MSKRNAILGTAIAGTCLAFLAVAALVVVTVLNIETTESEESTPAAEAEPEVDDEQDELEEVEEITEDEEHGFNERGNIPMPDNSPARIFDNDADELAVEWTSTEVSTSVECSNWYGEEADALLMSIDFEVEVFEGAQLLLRGEYSFSRGAFYIADEDGNVVDDRPANTSVAVNCIDNDDSLTRNSLRDGQSSQGSVVFQSTIDSGYLVKHDRYTGSYYEWEFSF